MIGARWSAPLFGPDAPRSRTAAAPGELPRDGVRDHAMILATRTEAAWRAPLLFDSLSADQASPSDAETRDAGIAATLVILCTGSYSVAAKLALPAVVQTADFRIAVMTRAIPPWATRAIGKGRRNRQVPGCNSFRRDNTHWIRRSRIRRWARYPARSHSRNQPLDLVQTVVQHGLPLCSGSNGQTMAGCEHVCVWGSHTSLVQSRRRRNQRRDNIAWRGCTACRTAAGRPDSRTRRIGKSDQASNPYRRSNRCSGCRTFPHGFSPAGHTQTAGLTNLIGEAGIAARSAVGGFARDVDLAAIDQFVVVAIGEAGGTRAVANAGAARLDCRLLEQIAPQAPQLSGSLTKSRQTRPQQCPLAQSELASQASPTATRTAWQTPLSPLTSVTQTFEQQSPSKTQASPA